RVEAERDRRARLLGRRSTIAARNVLRGHDGVRTRVAVTGAVHDEIDAGQRGAARIDVQRHVKLTDDVAEVRWNRRARTKERAHRLVDRADGNRRWRDSADRNRGGTLNVRIGL